MSSEAKSWPEFVGKNADDVAEQLKAEGFKPQVTPQGAPVTRDYRLNRVRLFVDDKNIIIQTPHNG